MGCILRKNSFWTICFLTSLFMAVSASGVVLHTYDPPSDPTKPPYNQPTDHPNNAVVGSWNYNASCVAISPNYIITTRHQNAGVGTTVTFGGKNYTVAEVTVNGSVDMRVARLELNGQPANLTSYVDVYTGSSEVGKNIVIGGFGKGRGDELPAGNGYKWLGTDNKTQRWGTNKVDGVESKPAYNSFTKETYTSQVLKADFDGPGAISSTSYEAAIAEYDSGGGWFVLDNDEWKLIGLSAYVTRLGESWFSPSDSIWAVRVSPYATWIEQNISSVFVAPGDANWDGMVNVGDLGVLAGNYGLTGKTWRDGDFNANGVVDVGDLGILAGNYGYGTAGGISTLDMNVLSVPEPATFAFILVGFASLFFNARRKRH
jgi:hypothetical protein